ncbi:LacI family DNA-binding transcriptional regulator [uncultured Dysosmobacter sp.]|uniref:LacI family DNA-binding transcriptional regulator n=1 Tax=uncultured Dysosmobacter sp. TaxID=2591384 RepID=UPI002609CA87|nr:LacI family DNA-binding transcriptional regulator [uncultured Dysosmobacter sp.]
MKKHRVTAKDVAELAGVSQSTVSMILNSYKNINFSDETRVRVLDACDRLGYRTLGNSRLNSVMGRLLLVVYPTFHNALYLNMIDGIQQRAGELGYSVLTVCTERKEEQEADIVRICREFQVAGVLLVYQPDNISAVQLLSMEVPLVQLYDKSATMGVNTMELDNYKIGQLIAEHLISLGHRYIAHISKPLTKTQSARSRRIEGLRSCMWEHGLDPDEYLHISTVETEHLENAENLEGYETGHLLVSHLLDIGAPVTAFAATNDMMAYGVMDAILERGKKIPQDYSVCGCDNLSYSAFQRIALTTVEPYTRQKALDSVDLLIGKIRTRNSSDREDSPVSITRIEYAPRLICRKSTARCSERYMEQDPAKNNKL